MENGNNTKRESALPVNPFNKHTSVSTVSSASSTGSQNTMVAAVSPVGTNGVQPMPYYPDDKIIMVTNESMSANLVIPPPPQRGAAYSYDVKDGATQNRGFSDLESQLPPRPTETSKPFWKNWIFWASVVICAIIVAIGVYEGSKRTGNKPATTLTGSGSTTASATSTVQPLNNTINTVATSGLFLNDGKTWNMQVYRQLSNGQLQYQMSTAMMGTSFQPAKNITVPISPKLASPLSATASTDKSGVVYLNLFYITQVGDIAMVKLSCPADSVNCTVTANMVVSSAVKVPVNKFTGLGVVNVDSDQDWRVFYHDKDGYVSQLQGNSTGFGSGEIIGGIGLNASSIAAVNVNQTTNNINVFYVDTLTQALVFTQYLPSAGNFTPQAIVSNARITNWNPRAGLAAAYNAGLDQLHVYYTGLDNLIYEFLGSKASTTKAVWGAQPGQNHIWGPADRPGTAMAAAGWNLSVRFFLVVQGKLAQGTLEKTIWTETFVSNT